MTGDLRRLLSTLRGGRLVIAIAVAVGLLIAAGRAFSAAYVEVLWQLEAGYASAFWTRVLWEWGVRAVAALAVGVILLINLWIASTTLGGIQIRRRFGNIEISEQIPRRYVWWGMLVASGLLALWIGAAIPQNLGLRALFMLRAGPWGLTDPVLGKDVGFYVFSLPFLRPAVFLGIMVTFLVFTMVTAAYAATGAVRWTNVRLEAQELPRLHLGILAGTFLWLLALQLWLQRYGLLQDGNSAVQGIFGYTDSEARMPALQTLSVICMGAGVGVVWGAWRRRVVPLLASFAAVVLGAIVIGQVYPGLVQRFRVEPNELARETPYIEDNLEFTRLGFGLDLMERRTFAYSEDVPIDWETVAREFAGLPVWNRSALLTTYRELEALFPYYDFDGVAIDRYDTPAGPATVAVAVRQVEPSGIQDPNWQNLHLRKRYIAGVGTVASLASVRTPEGRPQMLVSGIPPQVPAGAREVPGLTLEQPEIFFGTRAQGYAVVSPETESYLAADSTEGVPGVDYPAGIPLTSAFRTALLAWHFGDANLLFASELASSSRFVYRRAVLERALAIAPFLRFPEDPYPVVAEGRVLWVLEGFTGTGAFPLAAAADFGQIRSSVRYVRNSVKVTVDAVTGRVDLYRVPVDDPLADAMASSFPGLFKPIDEMPPGIREHLRYSRTLLGVQSRVLLQYHQETAPAFHGQQDVWNEPQELAQGTSPVAYRPDYGIFTLPGDDRPTFNLTGVFVPAGRQNLTGMLVGRSDASGIPDLVLLDVLVADQVAGPRQVEALVEQDPLISQQFSLWRTGGSQVWTGHLHVLPVGGRFVYMEPVFLAAEADAIPELRRFVVSDGRRVAMTEELGDAIRALGGEGMPVTVPSADGSTQPGLPAPEGGVGAWPSAALDLLERAESRARAGDWQGYGAALDELRTLLRTLDAAGGAN